MYKKKGQSIIEVVFAIVIVGLVMTGVVALIIKSSGGQTESGLRDKAVALSRLVMEEIIAESKNNPSTFWNRANTTTSTLTKSDYPGYGYAVNYGVDTGGNCGGGRVECILVTITVGWKGGSEDVTFSRFFSR